MKRSVIIGLVIGLTVIVVIGVLLVNSANIIKKTQTSDSGENEFGSQIVTNEVPAPGHEDVEEMIVNEGEDLDCEKIITLETPVDLSLVTSILYPGQVRGGDYKPHGGFRFDNSKKEDITVRAPIDAEITLGSRYYQDGILQYLFEFENECNVRYRFDHLLVLSEKLQAIADTFPEPVEGDSRTTRIDPVFIKQGEVVAVAVGVEGNVGVDFGVYDYRKRNDASETSELIKQYPSDLASHAVCWLDLLSGEDAAIVKAFPGGDGQEGKNSEYC